MNTYSIKIELDLEVEAFSDVDARDYVSEIFGVDEEVKRVKILTVNAK
jgi:hypothetical protein